MLHDCDVCNSSDAEEIACAREYTGGQPIHVCSNCGFVHVKERRSAEEAAKAWDGIWGESYNSNWPGVKARLYYVAEWFDQKFGWRDKCVLDIGAGQGTFLRMVKHRGAAVMGLEPNQANVEGMLTSGIPCVQGWVGQGMKLEPQYDVVTVLWTLENTADCRAVVQYAKGCLKPDGLLVIATGSRILVPPKKPLSSYFSKLPADLHSFRFGYEDLVALGYAEGMKPMGRNDYLDRDELVVVFRHGDIVFQGGLKWESDAGRAARVHQFFEDWNRLWP